MLTRKQQNAKRKHEGPRATGLSERVRLARRSLRIKGYSYRMAAPLLDVHFVHLANVLTGRRVSAALLERINALPDLDSN